ncbi:hypothetical protein E2C01_030032 [Portunus trituberculatus]|uniref:Uncharacterized protein n=1 Tax=Portunus trituberculatus TaxID=210409 RepID=A0A5B7EU27_PORTR|nr:hypothetical protein [Portunus trituberculatus]
MSDVSDGQVREGGDKFTLSPVTSFPPKEIQSREQQVKGSEESTVSPDYFTGSQSEEQVKDINTGEDSLTLPVTLVPREKNQLDEQMKGNEDNTPSSSSPALPPASTSTSKPTTPASKPSTFTTHSQKPQTNTDTPHKEMDPNEMGFLLPKGPGSLTRLHINVEGCGYDPCDIWWQEFGRLGSTYACYLSADGSLAVPEVDIEKAKTQVVLGMLPLVLMTVAVVILYVFYCPRKSNARKDNPGKAQEVKWEQARHMILKQVEKKDKKYMQFDPILVKAALRTNQVAPSTLAAKGGKKR